METNNLEAEIAELSRQIEEKRKALEESRGMSVEHQEAISEVVREKLTPGIVPTQSTSTDDDTDDDDKKKVAASTTPVHQHYLDAAPPQSVREINDLIELVPSKGVAFAIKEAKGREPFIMDGFHDALVDRLYTELKTRGYIK